jgi:hypothetical protein
MSPPSKRAKRLLFGNTLPVFGSSGLLNNFLIFIPPLFPLHLEHFVIGTLFKKVFLYSWTLFFLFHPFFLWSWTCFLLLCSPTVPVSSGRTRQEGNRRASKGSSLHCLCCFFFVLLFRSSNFRSSSIHNRGKKRKKRKHFRTVV